MQGDYVLAAALLPERFCRGLKARQDATSMSISVHCCNFTAMLAAPLVQSPLAPWDAGRVEWQPPWPEYLMHGDASGVFLTLRYSSRSQV